MAYYHGIRTSEVPTSLLPPVEAELPVVVVGTAPLHLAASPAKPNEPVLVYSYAEAVAAFGYSTDFEKYTLCEVINVFFALYGVAPVVMVAVENPTIDVSRETIYTGESVELSAETLKEVTIKTGGGIQEEKMRLGIDYTITDEETVKKIDLIGDNLPSDKFKIVYESDGETVVIAKTIEDEITIPLDSTEIEVYALIETLPIELEVDKDYTVGRNDESKLVITILSVEKLVGNKFVIEGKEAHAEEVTASKIIGGVDIETLKNTGLECIEDVYPKFRLTPGILIAPKFSQDVTVATVMKAKVKNINSVFNAIAIVDIPTSEVKSYTKAAEYKNMKNLIDSGLVVCYPKVSLGGVQYYMSTQLAALMMYTDATKTGGIPAFSPSNQRMQIDSAVLEDGTEQNYSLEQANYLNSQGIGTAINFVNGWTFWGDRTSEYPANTDPKDAFIPVRRTFYWLRNSIILSYWSKVDNPMNKRLVETLQDSLTVWLNGLNSAGWILGGRVEFRSEDNPLTSLIDGKVTFHVYFTPPVPCEVIEYVTEFDPAYFNTLFD